MANLAELTVAIGSDISNLESGLTRGEGKVDAFASKVSKTSDVAATGFTNAGAKVGGFGTSVDEAGTHADGLGAKLGRVGEIAGGFLAANVVGKGVEAFKGFIGDSIEAASALEKSVDGVSKVFGSSQQQILDWGKNNAASFGLSDRAFYDMALPLGAQLKSTGLSMDQVTGNTIALTQRAVDMASVFGTSVPDALNAIEAGLRGKGKGLVAYGVSLTTAKVEAEALAETHKTSAKDLTTQELALARVKLVMDQTTSSAGDFRQTSDQYANAQRIAAAKTEELQAAIGEKLVPVMLHLNQVKLALVGIIADKLMPVLGPLADWMTSNPTVFLIFATVIGGVLVAAFTAWAISAATAAIATLAAAGPVLLIIGAIALLAVGIALLISHWDGLSSAIGGFLSGAGSAVTGTLGYIGSAAVSSLGFIGSIFATGMGQVGSYVASGIAYAGSTFMAGLNEMGGYAASSLSFIGSIFATGMGTVGGYAVSGISYVGSAFMNGLNYMGSITVSGINYVVDIIAGLPSRIVSAVGNLGGLLYNAGADVVRGLWNGIASLGSWLETQVINFIKSFVPGPVLQFLGISSPSKLFEGIGANVAAGLAGGITGNTGMVESAATALAGAASGTFAPLAASGIGVGSLSAPSGVRAAGGGGLQLVWAGSDPGSELGRALLEYMQKSLRIADLQVSGG